MNLPFIPNYGLLNNTPSDSAGYVTKDGKWAAVPWGKKFVIICNGEQVHVSGTLAVAKSYINKQLKVSKTVKSSTSSLEEFL
jgi:NADH:ubiquinone oxidoreductase subunit E